LWIKLISPSTLEIKGIKEKHNNALSNRLVHDLFDPALRVLLHPGIDGVGSRGIGEIQSLHHRLEVVPAALDKVSKDWFPRKVPYGVGDIELDLGVGPGQQLDEALVGRVALLLGQAGQLQGGPHRVQRGAGRPVGRHSQGHRDAQGRDEDVLIRILAHCLPEQLQSEPVGRLGQLDFLRG